MQLVNKLWGCVALFLVTIPCAHSQPIADIELSSNTITVNVKQDVDVVSIRIIGNNYSYQKKFDLTNIVLDLTSLNLTADGAYQYEVTGVKYTGQGQVVNGNGRAPGAVMKESKVSTVHGNFNVSNQTIHSNF